MPAEHLEIIVQAGILIALALNAVRTGSALRLLREIREAVDVTDDALRPDPDGRVRVTPDEGAEIAREWLDVLARLRPGR